MNIVSKQPTVLLDNHVHYGANVKAFEFNSPAGGGGVVFVSDRSPFVTIALDGVVIDGVRFEGTAQLTASQALSMGCALLQFAAMKAQ